MNPHSMAIDLNQVLNDAIRETQVLYGCQQHAKQVRPVLTSPHYIGLRYPSEGAVTVCVQDTCKGDITQAYYQLGHEALHLLNCVDITEVTVLEEGLAVAFAHYLVRKFTGVTLTPGDAHYLQAWKLVGKLIDHDGLALSNLYQKYSRFSPISEAELLAVCPSLATDVVSELAKPFNTWKAGIAV
ncbi:hypothetical protein [Shewanella colwelliana]|uniref:hypothetical protein n=1 Tax=Shewanella colwelliana TaxID=23 RepID=UPI0022AE697B|nr:hypothetical protein [Shewanella colwelliana]MCZ4337744.1 hypothetical protein [Shewanella colwelliana]